MAEIYIAWPDLHWSSVQTARCLARKVVPKEPDIDQIRPVAILVGNDKL